MFPNGAGKAGNPESNRNTIQRMLPAAQLHWILADEEEAITVESVAGRIKDL